MIHILVTSAGTASAINVIKSLRLQKQFDLTIHAIDSDQTAPGLYLADRFVLVPRIDSPDYIPTIINYCQKEDITVVFPIHSSEIELFAEKRDLFKVNGFKMLIPPLEAIRICNNKRSFCDLARKIGIASPENYTWDEYGFEFPVIAKPNDKSGSKGIFKISDGIDFSYARAKFPNHLLQEWIEGSEVTVDCLYNESSRLLTASPRVRLLTKAGQCVKGKTVQNDAIVECCRRIGEEIKYAGPANIQFIIKDNIPYFIEMNPRFAAGGLMLTVHAGANIPLMILKLLITGEESLSGELEDGLLMLRYYEEIFLHDSK